MAIGVDAISLMHNDLELVLPTIDRIRTVWNGALVAYSHSGHFHMPRWAFGSVVPPAEFAARSLAWRDAGCQIVGGCCGTTPNYIRALASE